MGLPRGGPAGQVPAGPDDPRQGPRDELARGRARRGRARPRRARRPLDLRRHPRGRGVRHASTPPPATEYTETLRGIQDDLVTAAQNLALAAAEMRSRDENAGDAFVALLARWTDPAGLRERAAPGAGQGHRRGRRRAAPPSPPSTSSCGTTAPRSPDRAHRRPRRAMRPDDGGSSRPPLPAAGGPERSAPSTRSTTSRPASSTSPRATGPRAPSRCAGCRPTCAASSARCGGPDAWTGPAADAAYQSLGKLADNLDGHAEEIDRIEAGLTERLRLGDRGPHRLRHQGALGLARRRPGRLPAHPGHAAGPGRRPTCRPCSTGRPTTRRSPAPRRPASSRRQRCSPRSPTR